MDDGHLSGVLLKRHRVLRDAQKYKLFCPLCSQKMEPLIVDSTDDEDVKEETIWWTCQGLKAKTCNFPLSMPSEVFWTTRNAQQIENDVIPLPNFHLLPPKYHHLYDAFFKPTQTGQQKRTISRVIDQTFKRRSGPGSFPQRPSKVIRVAQPESQSNRRKNGKQNQAEVTIDRCLELVDSHVPYLPDVESINARLGKGYHSQKASTSHPIEWTEIGVTPAGDVSSQARQNTSPNENLPSCSSESTNSLEQTVRAFPEGHPLHVQSFGDPELDRLCNENLVGLLKSKELKKRRKKSKPKPVEQQQDVPPAELPDEQHLFDFLPEVNSWLYF